MKPLFLSLWVALTLLSTAAFAKEETISALSKSCNETRIKELGGDAVRKVVPNESGAAGVYDITFDGDKTTAQLLMKKLVDAKCTL